MKVSLDFNTLRGTELGILPLSPLQGTTITPVTSIWEYPLGEGGGKQLLTEN